MNDLFSLPVHKLKLAVAPKSPISWWRSYARKFAGSAPPLVNTQ